MNENARKTADVLTAIHTKIFALAEITALLRDRVGSSADYTPDATMGTKWLPPTKEMPVNPPGNPDCGEGNPSPGKCYDDVLKNDDASFASAFAYLEEMLALCGNTFGHLKNGEILDWTPSEDARPGGGAQ
jgi:hypothetical protein